MGREALAKRPEASSLPQFPCPPNSPPAPSMPAPWLPPGLFPFHIPTVIFSPQEVSLHLGLPLSRLLQVPLTLLPFLSLSSLPLTPLLLSPFSFRQFALSPLPLLYPPCLPLSSFLPPSPLHCSFPGCSSYPTWTRSPRNPQPVLLRKGFSLLPPPFPSCPRFSLDPTCRSTLHFSLASALAPTHPDVTPPHSPLSLATPPPPSGRRNCAVWVGGVSGFAFSFPNRGPRPLSAPQCEKKGRGLRGRGNAREVAIARTVNLAGAGGQRTLTLRSVACGLAGRSSTSGPVTPSSVYTRASPRPESDSEGGFRQSSSAPGAGPAQTRPRRAVRSLVVLKRALQRC